ncbi:MAG: S4 domain-containing protein YaaA [Bacilli bacterium]|nr:S4 domain-containing protein YaaA [Bacilli bacterium]
MNGSKTIKITGEYITLGQFLKFARIIDQGGEAKYYLATRKVLVNGEDENRRGRKLRAGDVIALDEGTFEIAQ